MNNDPDATGAYDPARHVIIPRHIPGQTGGAGSTVRAHGDAHWRIQSEELRAAGWVPREAYDILDAILSRMDEDWFQPEWRKADAIVDGPAPLSKAGV